MMMNSAIGEYFDALSRMDRQAYLACFSPDAVVQDPYGGRPLSGVDGLNKFMDGMERTWSEFSMKPGASYASGDRVAVNWAVAARSNSDKTAEFAGINVFTLDEEGKISQMEGYWDFKGMVAQIS